MRARLILAVVLLATAAGCTGGGTDEPPTPAQCHFPEITDVGSNAYYVGAVMEADEAPISQVLVRALPAVDGEDSQDTTNDAGCFFLDLTPGAPYDVTASKQGYEPATKTDQSSDEGEKVVVTFVLDAL